MQPDELRAILEKVSEQLRSSGGDASGVERLKEDPAIYEVVGKWPPDGSLPAPRAGIESAIDVLERARQGLIADAAAPEAAQLGGMIDQLRAHLIEADGVGGSIGENEEPDDAAELVAKWPPD